MKIKSKNRKAKYDYFLSDFLEVGIVLQGYEIKIAQEKGIDLTGSYVKIIDGEVWLLNATVSGVNFNKFFNNHKLEDYPIMKSTYEDATRPKKLLLHKKQIQKFEKKLVKGTTLIITEVYSDDNNRIKCTLALGKGKKDYDKREAIKERDLLRKN